MEENNQVNIAPILKKVDPSVDAYFNSLPCGYRFCPTDAELISEYLERKVMADQELPINRFREVDIYSSHPENLTEMYNLLRERESECYFFTTRERKYPNGNRPKRSADEGQGFWKATGKVEEIKEVNGNVIGFRRTLDFKKGTHQVNEKTDWKMHEYTLSKVIAPNKIGNNGAMKLDDCVLCKIYKSTTKSNEDKNEESEGSSIDSDLPVAVAATNIVTPQAFPDSIQPVYQHHDGEASGTSSTANKRHCGMSTPKALNNVGSSTYDHHQYFQNQMFGYHPGSINKFNNIQNYNMHWANVMSHDASRESFPSQQLPLPQPRDSVNQIPLVDSSSIKSPAHVRDFERSLSAGKDDGQGKPAQY